MTPQSLKSAILQLAIQGKLVPQRPEDGVARVPAALNTEKKKVRRHREEIQPPFDIPENWRWVRLGQLFDIARGGSPRPIKAFLTTEENGLNWIKIGDTDKNSKYINFCREKIIPAGLSKTRQVFKGDLLLTNSMSFGRPYILNIDGCIHDGWLVLHPATPGLFKDFFFYLLSSPVVFTQFQTAAAGAVVQNLNSDKVSQTLVPLPPLPEQHRIVAKIEELLPLIDRYEQAWTQLEDFNLRFPADMQKSLLQLAIQGHLVDQRPEEGTGEQLYRKILATKSTKKDKKLPPIADDEIPFEIPASWKWVRLATVTDKITDGSHNPPPNTGSGYPVISAKNIKNGLITFDNVDRFTDQAGFDKENPRTNITNGDIIMGIIGGSIGNVGLYTHDTQVIAQRSIAIMHSLIDTAYLVFVLKSPLIQGFLHSTAAGSAQGGVYLGTLMSLLVPLPPLAEQKRIVAKLEELLPLCERLKGTST